MKGDERRAALLSAMLDGGALADEIETLAPAVRRLRELLEGLLPDARQVAAWSEHLYARAENDSAPRLRLQQATLKVADMDAALAFYCDALGLPARDVGKRFSSVDAGGICIGLLCPGGAVPPGGGVRLELYTEDLDETVYRLRERGIAVDVGFDRSRRRHCAEMCDADGHVLILVGESPLSPEGRRSG